MKALIFPGQGSQLVGMGSELYNNFNIVKNSFVKLVKLIKEESEILSQIKNKKKYDCLLSKYDRSLDSKQLFKIFNRVEKFIKKKLPLIIKNQKKVDFHDF